MAWSPHFDTVSDADDFFATTIPYAWSPVTVRVVELQQPPATYPVVMAGAPKATETLSSEELGDYQVAPPVVAQQGPTYTVATPPYPVAAPTRSESSQV